MHLRLAARIILVVAMAAPPAHASKPGWLAPWSWPVCTQPAQVVCSDDCSEVMVCLGDGAGGYVPSSVAVCPSDGNYKCSAALRNCVPAERSDCYQPASGFTCNGVGSFPDPRDCQTFHFCAAVGAQSVPASCSGNTAYNPLTADCSLTTSDRVCTEGPVEPCTQLGQLGVVPENPNIYYICKQKDGQFVAEMNRCPGGQIFDISLASCVDSSSSSSSSSSGTSAPTSGMTTTSPLVSVSTSSSSSSTPPTTMTPSPTTVTPTTPSTSETTTTPSSGTTWTPTSDTTWTPTSDTTGIPTSDTTGTSTSDTTGTSTSDTTGTSTSDTTGTPTSDTTGTSTSDTTWTPTSDTTGTSTSDTTGTSTSDTTGTSTSDTTGTSTSDTTWTSTSDTTGTSTSDTTWTPPPTVSPTTEPTTTPAEVPSPGGPCTTQLETAVDPTDCRSYYECVGFVWVHLRCIDGYYFDPLQHLCVEGSC